MNKKFKTVSILALLLAAALMFSSCAAVTSEAQNAFRDTMEAFRSCDKKAINETYGFIEIASFVDKNSGEKLRDAVISTLSEMEYKVNSAESVSTSVVRLNVDIKTVDFAQIVDRYIDKVTELVDGREYRSKISSMNDEEYETVMVEKMIEAIGEADGEKAVKTLDVVMTKNGSTWKISGNSDEFLEALFTGLATVVEALT